MKKIFSIFILTFSIFFSELLTAQFVKVEDPNAKNTAQLRAEFAYPNSELHAAFEVISTCKDSIFVVHQDEKMNFCITSLNENFDEINRAKYIPKPKMVLLNYAYNQNKINLILIKDKAYRNQSNLCLHHEIEEFDVIEYDIKSKLFKEMHISLGYKAFYSKTFVTNELTLMALSGSKGSKKLPIIVSIDFSTMNFKINQIEVGKPKIESELLDAAIKDNKISMLIKRGSKPEEKEFFIYYYNIVGTPNQNILNIPINTDDNFLTGKIHFLDEGNMAVTGLYGKKIKQDDLTFEIFGIYTTFKSGQSFKQPNYIEWNKVMGLNPKDKFVTEKEVNKALANNQRISITKNVQFHQMEEREDDYILVCETANPNIIQLSGDRTNNGNYINGVYMVNGNYNAECLILALDKSTNKLMWSTSFLPKAFLYSWNYYEYRPSITVNAEKENLEFYDSDPEKLYVYCLKDRKIEKKKAQEIKYKMNELDGLLKGNCDIRTFQLCSNIIISFGYAFSDMKTLDYQTRDFRHRELYFVNKLKIDE
ncbi:MAG: hypothetical protein WCK82_10055 [Bacteroidota bacterium]